MRKLLILLVAFAFIFANAIDVFAFPEPKVAPSTLSVSTDQVNVGETMTLTAITPKQGSGYAVEWEGAQATNGYLDEATDNYVSEATFTPTQPGSYTINYTIKMFTGNNDVKFIGSASKTINVVADHKEVIGLEARNVNAYPMTYADGTLSGYSVVAELYVLWNDNSSTLNGDLGYFFSPNEKSRVVDKTVTIDGKIYTFPVTITIN